MNARQVVVLVTDNNYFKHTESLIGSLRSVGGYGDDIVVLVAEDVTLYNIKRLMDRGISHKVVRGKTHYLKMNIFSHLLKRWQKVLYFDADFIIHSEIQPLFDQIIDDLLYVDFEPFKIREYLSNKESYHYRELEKSFDLDKLGFNAGFVAFNTRLAGQNVYDELVALQHRYKTINHHTESGGGDQPLVNIKFHSVAKQIEGVGFIASHSDGNRIASHCTRWHAPWDHHQEYYKNGLEVFERLV